MNITASSSTERVAQALLQRGLVCQIMEMPNSTRTAQEAADTLKCAVAQIAKSLVFRATESARAVLVITSGSNRVDERKVSELLGETIERADADFVRDKTGFAIGGVAPIGHLGEVVTFVDQDLLSFDHVFAAAGSPFAIFRLERAQLLGLFPQERFVEVAKKS